MGMAAPMAPMACCGMTEGMDDVMILTGGCCTAPGMGVATPTCGMTRSEGGRAEGSSNPLSFMLMSLQAMENSFRSIWPSPFTSARPLRKHIVD